MWILTEEKVQFLESKVDSMIAKQKNPPHSLINQVFKIKMQLDSFPKLKCIQTNLVTKKITCIQNYIKSLEYNYLGDAFFVVRKSMSVRTLCKLSKEMIDHGLPIKCLEAVVIGLHLTMGLDIERIRISNLTSDSL